ncbi:MAG TPA: sigma-70 family RNA polymerase sigma factor [Planctomycetaceae bacterium]|nr:sigma-70 family RNA polymerase sigma factor [Planctomycetaceae bacterium]
MEPDAVNQELIARARVGDQAALGELLQKYRGFLWGLADKLLDDRAAGRIDASDLVQQTCLSVHKQIAEFNGHDAPQFAAWLRQIHERNIRNAARDQLHAGKRNIDREKRQTEADAYVARQTSPSQHVVRSEESIRLARAIEQLPPQEQEALRRRYLEGESMVEIAAAMGLTKDALVWLMKCAMTSLRQILAERD